MSVSGFSDIRSCGVFKSGKIIRGEAWFEASPLMVLATGKEIIYRVVLAEPERVQIQEPEPEPELVQEPGLELEPLLASGPLPSSGNQ